MSSLDLTSALRRALKAIPKEGGDREPRSHAVLVVLRHERVTTAKAYENE